MKNKVLTILGSSLLVMATGIALYLAWIAFCTFEVDVKTLALVVILAVCGTGISLVVDYW